MPFWTTTGKRASYLLELAQALQADGQSDRSIATAEEGLAVLSPPRPGDLPTRIRKLLEAVVHTASCSTARMEIS